MRIYPAIDIKNGKCVRLRQGNFDDMTVYNDNPVEVAKEWIKNGASYIHLVDLDGAKEGSGVNSDIIKEIVNLSDVPVQTGGGIRTIEDIENKLALGVRRVILGTVAVKNPEIVKEAVEKFGDAIAVGIDAKNGMVAVSGWEEVSEVSAVDLCVKMRDYGVKTIIYTDISKDGMMGGPNIEATKEIVDATGIDIIASGGVSGMNDLENVAKINAHGAIIGKALYTGAINLKEAVDRFERG